MDPNQAAAIVALRPAIESLVIRASQDPEQIVESSPLDDKVINIVRQLCQINAGRHELEPVSMAMAGYVLPSLSFVNPFVCFESELSLNLTNFLQISIP